jgi:hypothetical protein
MAKNTKLTKEDTILVRLDTELAEQVRLKASRMGGAPAVIRALLRRWVEEDIVSAEQVLAETGRTGEVAEVGGGRKIPRAK